jgi:nucleoredoxin
MSLVSLLGDSLRKPDGSTINTAEALKDKDVLALYFSAHWCPPCRGFTPVLCKKYTELKESGKSFEMIFVSSDRDEAAFTEYHDSMTFLGLPFAERDAKAKLSKKFKISGIPSLVFYDIKEDKVITTEGREAISDDNFVEAFPYTPEPFSMALLGEELRKPGGEVVKASEELNKDIIGLYFSAHWCPPCRGFTPELSEKHNQLQAAGKSLALVFLSSDRDEKSFNEYHDSMSFLAMPFANRQGKEALSKIFKVEGIPSLVFLDCKTGEVITSNGRAEIRSKTFIEDFPYHPKPMYDLADSQDGINDEVSLLVLMESAGDNVKKDLSATLMAIATAEKKKPENEQRAGCFFTCCGGGPASRVRQLCGLKPSADSPTPVMLILDLDDEGSFYHPLDATESVTEANLQAFLDDFKTGKLTKHTVG